MKRPAISYRGNCRNAWRQANRERGFLEDGVTKRPKISWGQYRQLVGQMVRNAAAAERKAKAGPTKGEPAAHAQAA
jgi:hypothetical protein